MRRLLLLLVLLALPSIARAQFTTVTATVVDPTGAVYQNCFGNASFVPSPNATQVPIIAGGPVPTPVVINSCDSFGHFTILLADNNQVQDGHTAPPASQWRINICAQSGSPCNSVTLTITGSSQDISAALQPMPILPVPGGGGLPCTTLTYAPTVTANVVNNDCYTVTLTGNVTVQLGGTPKNGNILKLQIYQDGVGGHGLTLPGNFNVPAQWVLFTGANAHNDLGWVYDGPNSTWQPLTVWVVNNIGTFTVATLPASPFLNQIAIVTDSSNGCTAGGGSTRVSCQWTGATWVPVGGGGSANPLGNNGDLQMKNGALLAASHINDNGTIISHSEDVSFAGPNPYVDVRSQGARPTVAGNIPSAVGITATIANGSNSATVSTQSCPGQVVTTCFLQGDGVVIYGAGATQSMTTPTAPTVVPSVAKGGTNTNFVTNSATAATSYGYEIVARDKNGGLTAASPAGTIANGLATLGIPTAPITSCTRSNLTVSCTLSSPHNYLVGCSITNCGEVYTSGFSDPSFNGWWTVTSAVDNTHFTWTSNFDTRNGATLAPTGVTTTGTAQWFANNYVTWSAVTGAFEYYIYGRNCPTTCNLIGISRPEGIGTYGGASVNTDYTFEDYGSPFMDSAIFPPYVPTTPPSVATADHLATTITGVAGNVLTLAASAGNAVCAGGGCTIRLDQGPILSSTYSLVGNRGGNGAQGGSIYIPPDVNNGCYVVNSYTNLTFVSPNRLAGITQGGCIQANETIEVTAGQKWYGDKPFTQAGESFASFQVTKTPWFVVNTASPGLYINALSSIEIRGLSFFCNTTNGCLDVFGEGAYFSSFVDDTFKTGGGSNDYTGIGLYLRGGTQNVVQVMLNRDTFDSGLGTIPNALSHTPSFLCRICSTVDVTDSAVTHKGAFFVGDPNSGTGTLTWVGNYSQGLAMPFMSYGFSGSVNLSNIFLDSVADPLCSGFVLGGNINPGNCNGSGPILSLGNASTSGPPNSGGGATNFSGNFTGTSYQPLPSRNAYSFISGTANDGIYGIDNYLLLGMEGGIAVGPSYPMFVANAAQAAPTCAVSAGGTHSAGSFSYRIGPVWQNNSVGILSYPSSTCTTTGGNLTITVNWTTTPGNPIGYYVYEDTVPTGSSGLSCGGIHTGTSFVLSAPCAGGFGNAPSLPSGGPTMLMPGVQGISAPAITLTGNTPSLVLSGASLAPSGTGTITATNGNTGTVFTASTNCAGANCVNWVDDDSTDNCGASTTSWIAAINAYAGKGVPQVWIMGSGSGKAYKFTACNLVFTNSRGVAIHLWGTIDCNMSLQSCIQFGTTATSGGGGSNSNLLQNFRLDCHGGTLINGVNLTGSGGNGSTYGAGVYIMPHISAGYIHGCNFGEVGAGLGFGETTATYGTCKNFSVFFDFPLPTGAVTDSIIFVNTNGITSGGCAVGNPNGASTGSNTIQLINNIITTDGEASGAGQCGSIAIMDGGTLSYMAANNIFGFGIPILLQGIAHKVVGNQLDSTQCAAGGVAATIQLAGSAVGPVAIEQNSVQLGSASAHASALIQDQNGQTPTLSGFIIRDNVNNVNLTTNVNVFGGTVPNCSVTLNTYCLMSQNVAMDGTTACGTSQTGWQLDSKLAQCTPGGQAANITTTLLFTAPTNRNVSALVTCGTILTTAATTSSTLPTCNIAWTDVFSNTAQTAQITNAWASGAVGCNGSATNTVGNSCQGSVYIFAKANTAVNFTTSNYASTGATAMQYTASVVVMKQ